jgi:hypothetical protein
MTIIYLNKKKKVMIKIYLDNQSSDNAKKRGAFLFSKPCAQNIIILIIIIIIGAWVAEAPGGDN